MTLVAPVTILSRFGGTLGQALARRGRALLDSHNLQEEVAALGVTELYLMIKELGVDEALPLLLASGEGRLQALIDFDCWDRDRFEAADLDVWLAPFADEGQEALAAAFLALDEEVQVLFLQAILQVYEGPAHDNPHISHDQPSREVPGGLFTLVARDADGDIDALKLVDALMAVSMASLFQLLTALTWELPSTLEEQAYSFRSNRMMDLGFMAPEDAARLFAPPPKVLQGKVQGAHVPQAMPALYAAALADGETLLHRALEGVTDSADAARLEAELVYLINGSVVGWHLTVRSLEDVRDAALWVRNILSLALEALCGDSPQEPDAGYDGRLTGTILTAPLVHLFQRGLAEIVPLAARAQRLVRQHGSSQDSPMAAWLQVGPQEEGQEPAEAALRAFVAGLDRGRPYWGGSDPVHPGRRSMWRSRRELAESARQLEALELRFGRDVLA